jgi:hypothetical protein
MKRMTGEGSSTQTWIIGLHESVGSVVDGQAHDGHVICVQDPMDEANPFPPERDSERETKRERETERERQIERDRERERETERERQRERETERSR